MTALGWEVMEGGSSCKTVPESASYQEEEEEDMQAVFTLRRVFILFSPILSFVTHVSKTKNIPGSWNMLKF